MLATNKQALSRVAKDVVAPAIIGIDVTRTDAGIMPGFCRDALNINTRGNSVFNPGNFVSTQIDTSGYGTGISAECCVTKDGSYWGFWAVGPTIRSVAYGPSSPSQAAYVLDSTTNPASFVSVISMTPYRDRVIIIDNPSTNTYVQYTLAQLDPGNPTVWTARRTGIEMPRICDIQDDGVTTAPTGFSGYFRYAVEFIRKDTTSTTIINSSGVSRAAPTIGPLYTPTGILQGNTLVGSWGKKIWAIVPATTSYWTHARLWRSKRLDADSTGIINGDDATLYCVQELTYQNASSRAVAHTGPYGLFTSFYFDTDITLDSALPNTSLSALVTTPQVLELQPIQNFQVLGVVGSTKLFAGNLPTDPSGIYPSAGQYGYVYEEQYAPADRHSQAASGAIMAMQGLNEDLIFATVSDIWRNVGAQPTSPIVSLGNRQGVKSIDRLRCFPNWGTILLGTDGVMRFLDQTYKWQDGVSTSTVSQASESLWVPGVQASYRFLSCRTGTSLACTFVNGTDYWLQKDGKGWIRRTIPNASIKALWYNGNDEGAILWADGSNHFYVQKVDPNGSGNVTASIVFGPFQASKDGSGLVEDRGFRLIGQFGSTVSVQVGVDSAGSLFPWRPMVEQEDLSGAGSFSAQSVTRTRTFKEVDSDDFPRRIYGERLFYRVTLAGTYQLDMAIAMLAILEEPPASSRLAGLDGGNVAEMQANLTSGLLMRFVSATNPPVDYYGHGPLTGG